MNSVFRDNKSQSQDRLNTIDHTTPGMYVYNPLSYTSSFERVTDLMPTVSATPVTNLTKKRKSMSVHTEFKTLPEASDSDILEYFRISKNTVGREPCAFWKRLEFDPLMRLCDKDVEDVDFQYENTEEICEDFDMEKQLREMTVIPM